MSQCIIVADADQQKVKSDDLALLQVIEAIAYHRAEGTAKITLDLLISNQRSGPCKLLLVHRGTVSFESANTNLLRDDVSLIKQIPEQGIPSDAVLKAIYEHRIESRKDLKSGFLERVNCFSCAETKTIVDYSDPQLVSMSQQISAASGDEDYIFLPYSCVEIGTMPHGLSWFRVRLRLSGATYRYLIESPGHFWVDGPERVLEQIEKQDLPERGSLCTGAKEFFDSRISAHALTPKAYDVVVFRPGVAGVDTDTECTPITGGVYSAAIEDPSAKRLAHLFVTRSPSFWIDVAYVKPSNSLPSTTNVASDQACSLT